MSAVGKNNYNDDDDGTSEYDKFSCFSLTQLEILAGNGNCCQRTLIDDQNQCPEEI